MKPLMKPWPDPWPTAPAETTTCGECRYFKGFDEKGLTCQQLHGVSENSWYCVEFNRVNELENKTIEDIKRDPSLLKILNRIESTEWFVDKTLINELEQMFIFCRSGYDPTIRNSVEFPTTFYSENDIVPLAKHYDQAQAYRDRAALIYVSTKTKLRKLKRLLTLAESIVKKYPVVSNIDDAVRKKATISEILEPLEDKIDLATDITETCDTIMSNLVNTHFTLKEIKDVGMAYLGRRNKI